jgi:hypothetical protein
MKALNKIVSSSKQTNDTGKVISRYFRYDQLKEVIRKNKAFSKFLEPAVSFLPTFKFSKRSDLYDINSKSSRCPSWTDRILYFCNSRNDGAAQDDSTLRPEDYFSIPDCRHGDHRPVCATFKFRIQ